VDRYGNGQLTETELSSALVNGDYTAFDPSTIRLMIKMFDTNRSGTIGYDEFCNLWAFLGSWRALFERFDVDGSGGIGEDEYSQALLAFGYHLSAKFVGSMFKVFSKGRGEMGFDVFVQSCISLKRMTDVFKRYDDDRDGYITLSFEEFLTGEF
jgi:Ca2+-binding EF-hand superfamily protein